ncbi:Fumigermin synthase [Cladobotryum mycophilum]|uniref:Fumigermin synthase n=1 Tax=Cladobotryum mycophilum TaxID=491253 RepID=A0ABR0S9K2_9HYPO
MGWGCTKLQTRDVPHSRLYFLREPELLDFIELAMRLSPATIITNSHLPSTAVSAADVDHSGKLSYQHPWTSTGQMAMGLWSEGDLNDPNTRTNWRRDRRMGFYHNFNDDMGAEQKGSSGELAVFLSGASYNPHVLKEVSSAAFLAQEIGRKILSLMLKAEDDLDTGLTLQQIGLDSLMAIELRR